MNRELELMRAAALAADGFYKDSKEFGKRAARSFSGENGKSQVRNLVSIANSALKVSDPLDYIKKQVGKEDPKSPAWRRESFGEDLLKYLEEELGRQAEQLTEADKPDPRERQRMHIQLIQQFVVQLAAEYEFTRKDAAAPR